ncbi:DUF1659 domain-containing protein [Scopulibacillus cellulosilyticus]|uniref:DUF1659 domain-containing protein n=1 Tax=Scopulibacillus cellulosilyticus TaxID=2665665 RepID=A0ABW2PWJ2_9BACL
MAMSTLTDTALVMSLDGGMNKDGKPVIKKKSFRNVKINATDDQLYNVAKAIAPLQQYPLISIERNNTVDLVGESK